MPRKSLENLTESMFYLLMAFCRGPACGTDAAAWVREKTAGRCRIGPATLYTILAKFEQERYIREVAVEGRKRTYQITNKGRDAYREELERLRQCLRDAESEPDERSDIP